jgi:hypothetical protein
MAAQTTSEVWDSRWSSTRRTVEKKAIDNIFQAYKALEFHRRRGLQMVDSGGKEIQVILESANGTAEAFDGYDPLSKSPIDPFESAFYKRRYYAVPIILDDTTNWENSGEEQIFDLLEALGSNALNSLLKAINSDLMGAQTGKTMLGYQDIIADAGTGTVGGINSSSSSFWQNQKYTDSKTFTAQTVTNVFDGMVAWNNIMDDCRKQGGNNDAIVTTYSIAAAYRTALSSQGYGEVKLSNVQGVKGAEFPGYMGADLIADVDCAALHSYHVDTSAIKLRVMRQANFKKTPFVSLQSNGQLAQLAYMVAGVQLTTNNRRRSGVATALTGL